MKYVFETLGYRRYEWKCDNMNYRSKRAAERFGFKFEGIIVALRVSCSEDSAELYAPRILRTFVDYLRIFSNFLPKILKLEIIKI